MKVEQTNFVTHLIITAVLDPDLEIRWGGRSSSPLHKGGGGGGVSKQIFSALRASVWSNNRGAPRAPPLDLPLYSTIIFNNYFTRARWI